MSPVRVACLIVLTLAATTLSPTAPALWAAAETESARLSGAPQESAHHAGDTRDGTTEKQSSERDTTTTIHIGAPEVWDGGSARALAAGSGLIPVAWWSGQDACVPIPSAHLRIANQFEPFEIRHACRLQWLTCRIAHAPPAFA